MVLTASSPGDLVEFQERTAARLDRSIAEGWRALLSAAYRFKGRADPALAVSRFLGANESGWELIPSGWEPATRSRWGIVSSPHSLKTIADL